jgi:hypothetical protein
MSEKVYHQDGIVITAFAGGQTRGRCLQIEVIPQYAQLTLSNVLELSEAIREWIGPRKYGTREISRNISDFAGLLDANKVHLQTVMDRETIADTVMNLEARIKDLREMAAYLYDAKESI